MFWEYKFFDKWLKIEKKWVKVTTKNARDSPEKNDYLSLFVK